MVSSILHSFRKHVFALSSCHRSMSRMEWRNQEDEEWPKLVLFVIIKGCNHMISHDQIIHVWGRQPSNVLWHLELWRSPSPCHDAPALYTKGPIQKDYWIEQQYESKSFWQPICKHVTIPFGVPPNPKHFLLDNLIDLHPTFRHDLVVSGEL